MTKKKCLHCGEPHVEYRQDLVRLAFLRSEAGDAEKETVLSLSTRERTMVILREVRKREKGEK